MWYTLLKFLYEYIKVDKWGTSANVDRYFENVCVDLVQFIHMSNNGQTQAIYEGIEVTILDAWICF